MEKAKVARSRRGKTMPGTSSRIKVSRWLRGDRASRPLALLAFVLFAPFGGCGYSIRAPFDKSVQTVFVPVLKTQSFRRDLNLNLTEMIQKEIMHRTPYHVVGSPEGADTILEGTINFANKNTVVENPWNLPRELNATVNAKVKWTHNPPTEDEEKEPPTVISETVNFVPEVGETAMTAYYAVNQRLAAQIVDMMEKPWYTERDFK
ncbi:MAG: LPS assembly lipoprotein LptE [Isosphaeraceae bacterium]